MLSALLPDKLDHALPHFFAVLQAVTLRPLILHRATRLDQIIQIFRVIAVAAILRNQRADRAFSARPAAIYPFHILGEDINFGVVAVKTGRV